MKSLITPSQIILSVLLIAAILLQARGTGLGSLWGGTGESYRSKRGLEKALFIATIVLAALFLLLSVAILLV